MPGFIPWKKVDLLLRSHRSIWICTTRPNGSPHAVPVWYIWDGKDIYFITQLSTQKAKNLKRQPQAVVHLGNGDDAVILEGKVEIVKERGEQERINALYMEKYVDPFSGAQATIFNEGDDLYQVRITHVMAWEYASIGTRTDWRME